MTNNSIHDPKHNKTTKILKIVGPFVITVGLVFSVIGLVSFFTAISSGDKPTLFWCAFIGLPLLAVGGWLTSLGYMKKWGSFVASQTAPVAKDTINYIVDGTSDTIAKTINKAKNTAETENNFCPYCQKSNAKDAKYCSNCGKPLKITCQKCGTENDTNANFCDSCGAKLK